MTLPAHKRFVSRLVLAALLSLFAGLSAAPATEVAGARAFLVWVFSHYPLRDPNRFDPIGRSSGSVFDPPMIALFRENDRLTPKGDEGALDGDPICDCQDDGGLVVKHLAVSAKDVLGATATVDLVFAGGDKRTMRFDLVRVGGHWRIHDIHTKDTPSLRAYLIDSNQTAARARR